MTHHVYTFWHDRTPLYVGCTGNLRQRMAAHHGSAHDVRANWISVVPFEDEDEAFGAEADLIWSLRPLHNVQHNPRRMRLVDYLGPEYEDIYDFPPLYPPVPWEQLVGAINRLSTPEVGAS